LDKFAVVLSVELSELGATPYRPPCEQGGI